MRQHLYDCFENGRMAAFPEKKVPRRLRQRVMRVKSVAVYCTCRQTDNGLMIEYHTCKEWYHSECKPDIPADFWNTDKWYICAHCQETATDTV